MSGGTIFRGDNLHYDTGILGKEVDYFGEEFPASTAGSIGILCLEGEDPVMLMAPH